MRQFTPPPPIFILIFIVYLLVCFNLQAQVSSFKADNKTLKKENNVWLIKDDISNHEYEVNTRSFTVKLNEDADFGKYEKLLEKNNIQVERENILGYIDLIFPMEADFYKSFDLLTKSKLFESVDINSFGKTSINSYPNDPEYQNAHQWHLNHINMPQAWGEYARGNSSIIVAILDVGVDYNNQDLGFSSQDGYSNMWSNYGYNYYTNQNNPLPQTNIQNDFIMLNHGTVMAGLISGKTNNGQAIAGVAGGWNGNGVKIMAIRTGRVLTDGTGIIDAQYVDDAIIYAAQNGAKIINMSFGISSTSAINNAINYAYNHYGCFLVAAAGNDVVKATNVAYPASNTNVIAVGGVNKQNQNNNQWTTGSGMFIVAPAVDIWSLKNTQFGGNYAFGNYADGGTSSAAAIVSGVSALIASNNTFLFNRDIKKVLQHSATYLGTPTKYGYGLVNAYNALWYSDLTTDYFPTRPTNLYVTGSAGQHPTINWYYSDPGGIDRFFIYRADVYQGRYNLTKVATVYSNTGNNYSWTDNTVTIYSPRTATGEYVYRVTGYWSGLESHYSDEVAVLSNNANKAVSETKNEISYKTTLLDNYPNPFNPTTKINYSLGEDGVVKIRIIDTIGRVVEELVNGYQTKGQYDIQFDAKNLASGIYFYSLEINNYKMVKKMILLR